MAKITFAAGGSADKHGIPRADAEHAVRNHRFWIREFDEPRPPSLTWPDLFIGPDRSGKTLLEVMANWRPGGELEIFHVMLVREKVKQKVRRIHEERRGR